jgi:hypothetical protein
MRDDGARGAEITVVDGELPYCPDCQVKHIADLIAHIDPKGDDEKLGHAQWIKERVRKEVGMSKMEMQDYEKIRELEHKYEDGLTVLRDLRHKIQVTPAIDNPTGNPHRKYLPYGLTEQEKSDPELRKLLSRCIRKVEKKQCPPDFKGDYTLCTVNPAAVCRASVERHSPPRLSSKEFQKQMELLRETSETPHPTVKYPERSD